MFTGRKRELALLEGALKPGASVALVGASGMGKSELARAYIAGREALWIDCGGMTEDELTVRIASEREGDQARGLDVLVLDDWTPEMPLSAIRQQFEGAILLTSSVAPPEIPSLPVPPFESPTLEKLRGSEAFELFENAANGVRLGAAAECDAAAVHEIIERVGGHPLGIVLAARHAAAIGAAEVARLIRTGTELTDEHRSPRQRSMAVALEFSWQRLSERNQTVLFLASRFERPVRVVTLAELAGLTVNDVLDAIRELTQCGAVLPGPFPRPVRIWRDLALRRFVTDRADAAEILGDRVFASAAASARTALNNPTVGSIDDTPSIWEAALIDYQQRDREEVGVIAAALLSWSHRFAPRRYLASDNLEEVVVWSANAHALMLRVSFARGEHERHLPAIEAARAVVTSPADHAMLHFELAMAASIRADVDAALGHLADARQCEANYAAMLLEVSLRMFRGEREEAAQLLEQLAELEAPSRGHAVVAAFHQTWLLPPGQRLEHAQSVARSFEDATPRILARAYRSLADVLERDHGQHEEARALREKVLELALKIEHAKLANDMRCELAWGSFCAGALDDARAMRDIDPELLTADTKLRHTSVLAMFACLDGDTTAAKLALGAADRQLPHVPSVLGVLDVVDAAIALQDGGKVDDASLARAMEAAFQAGKQGHRDQIAVFNALREVREDHDVAARFAAHWIAAHGSPFLQRLAALDKRPEHVVTLADCSAVRVDGEWHHVTETSAAMLRVLTTGHVATFEELKEAAWPDEVITWDAVVNRINVRVSQLRGLGLKSVLRKTQDGFVLDCSVFVEGNGGVR